jgi:serine/threonine protein kinase
MTERDDSRPPPDSNQENASRPHLGTGFHQHVRFDLSEIADRYKILGVIGEGGMGKIFRAVQVKLNREVAIKVMTSPEDEDSIRRFILESSITAKLDHPNIVQIFDFGQLQSGAMYLVMELLNGMPLENFIESNGSLGIADTVKIALQVSGALAEAHGQNIVHRDIKPENILVLDKPGIGLMAKVIDFGLVKNLLQNTNLSATGLILGSPMYMAPEQVNSNDVDARTDIYSLGMTLYYCLTGREPYEGLGLLGILQAQLETLPEPASDYAPQLQECPAIGWIIERAIEKEPAKRFQSAEQLLKALQILEQNQSKWSTLQMELVDGELRTKAPSSDELDREEEFDSFSFDAGTETIQFPLEDIPFESIADGVVEQGGQQEPVDSFDGFSESTETIQFPSDGLPDLAQVERAPESTEDASSSKPKHTTEELSSGSSTLSAPAPLSPGSSNAKVFGIGLVTLALGVAIGSQLNPAPPAPVTPAEPVDLVPRYDIALETVPSGADVFRNGNVVGSTPYSLRLKDGESVEVEIRMEGFKSRQMELNPDTPAPKLIMKELKK